MGAQQSKSIQQDVKPTAGNDSASLTTEKHAPDTVDSISPPVREMADGLVLDDLVEWNKAFEADPVLALSRLVLSKSDPIQTLASRSALIADPQVFNTTLKGLDSKGAYPTPRVNQGSSGRCWLFATTNVLRYNIIEQLNLGEFQLSQSYLFFYDKLEKANYYLENMLELVDEPLDSRIVSYLNQAPVNDGGQWDMAVNLIEKYGVIPQSLFPESYSSSASGRLDSLITSKLRESAVALRAAKPEDRRKLKTRFLGEVYNVLGVTLGVPPRADEQVTWEYLDKDGKFHSWSGTPREFYAQHGKRKNMDPAQSFSLIHDPRNDVETLYTVARLGNVWGGKPVRYVNAPITALEDAVIACIKANTPLFFGCDVGKSSNTAAGVMDLDLYPLDKAYGFSLRMTKAERLRMGETAMTHAMVITAVHLDKAGRPVRYRVENSWSDSAGDKGWFMMTTGWFRENVFQVVVPRSVAEGKWTKVLDGGNAVVLDAWDPMGSLA